MPKRAEAVELVSLLDELNDSQASRDAPRAKEVERRRAAVLRLAQQRARLQVLCCQQLTGPACGILGKLNIARTLSAGRISEAALCAVCFLAMSSSLGRERLIAAGVCELLLQTGREHSDIEAVAEWVCRAVSALCSVGGIPGRSSGTASDGPSDNVLQRVLAASVGRELSIGERGRGRLVELGAIHMLLTRLIAEHVSPWLSRQRLPNRQAAAVATPPRRASRKSSFTGHLLLLLEGSVIIDCICLGLYCLCYQNQVYKRMLQSAQGSPVHSSRYVDNDHGLLAAEDTIGGLHSIFKWVAHRCQVIGSLMEAGAGAEDQTAQCGSYRNILVLPLSVDTSQPAGDAPVCVTMTWIWRLVASLAAYDHSVRTEEDVESVGGGTGSLSTGRRSSMGTSSIYSAQSTSSAKALLGSLGVGEALVASLRCCGTASQGMARAAFSAVGAVCLGSRRNQIQLVDSGMPVISVEVLQFHWDAYREQRTNLLALNDIHIEMDVCNETSSGRLRDAEESFEGLLREACIALKALCQDSEAAASRLTESTLCSLLMTIMQYCFELEGGARPISYLWYLVATLLTHRDLRVSLVADHNICTFLSMSMKLHGVNQDVAIWLATASIGTLLIELYLALHC